MSKRPRFEEMRGPYSWENAIAWWDKGRPDIVALMVSKEPIPEQHRATVAERIMRPPPQAKAPKRAFLDREAKAIRAFYEARKLQFAAAGESSPGKRAFASICADFGRGVTEHTMRDVVEGQHSYAPSNAEQITKPPHRKRVTTKRR